MDMGVILPHPAEGVTHIDAKGDGRHFISNGKDQAVKLWDLRRCHSQADLARGVASMRGLPRYQWCAPGPGSSVTRAAA
jgi:DDB1- and CUL4-associated factor 11